MSVTTIINIRLILQKTTSYTYIRTALQTTEPLIEPSKLSGDVDPLSQSPARDQRPVFLVPTARSHGFLKNGSMSDDNSSCDCRIPLRNFVNLVQCVRDRVKGTSCAEKLICTVMLTCP